MICGRIPLNPMRGQDDCLPMYVVRNPYCKKRDLKAKKQIRVLNFLAPDQMYPLIGNFSLNQTTFQLSQQQLQISKGCKGNGSQSWYIGFCDNLEPVFYLFSSYSTLVSVYTQFYLYLFQYTVLKYISHCSQLIVCTNYKQLCHRMVPLISF